ncbi:unnamed protein product [Symbiodinium sp. CCMP2592]|nr:unnamed protein product [Symbiodinium sp. CCMP2592]
MGRRKRQRTNAGTTVSEDGTGLPPACDLESESWARPVCLDEVLNSKHSKPAFQCLPGCLAVGGVKALDSMSMGKLASASRELYKAVRDGAALRIGLGLGHGCIQTDLPGPGPSRRLKNPVLVLSHLESMANAPFLFASLRGLLRCLVETGRDESSALLLEVPPEDDRLCELLCELVFDTDARSQDRQGSSNDTAQIRASTLARLASLMYQYKPQSPDDGLRILERLLSVRTNRHSKIDAAYITEQGGVAAQLAHGLPNLLPTTRTCKSLASKTKKVFAAKLISQLLERLVFPLPEASIVLQFSLPAERAVSQQLMRGQTTSFIHNVHVLESEAWNAGRTLDVFAIQAKRRYVLVLEENAALQGGSLPLGTLVYYEQLSITEPVVLVGAGKELPTIWGGKDGVVVSGAGASACALRHLRLCAESRCHALTVSNSSPLIEGCEIVGSCGDPARGAPAGLEVRGQSGPVIRECRIFDHAGAGIAFLQGANGLVAACDVTRCACGIWLEGEANPIIWRNTLAGHRGAGVVVRASGRGCITGNTILRNGAGGLLVESSRRAVTTIVRNRVWANSGCDLRQSPTSTGLLAGKAAAVTLANTVGHQDSPSASHGTELTAIWPQRVVINARDLRAAVREAPSDGFTFLQLQGKVVLEEPLVLDKPVILAGESLTGDSGSVESRGELHGPPGGSVVIIQTAESCALWRLNLVLSPASTPACCLQVETGSPVLVDCDLQVHGVQLDGSVPTHCVRAAGGESKLLLIGCSLAGATGNGLLLVDGASASMVRCQVKSNRQGGVFLADGASLLAESSDISRNGHFGVVEDIVNIHADSDDYVTEVVDVTGGSDEEDLVEVKAGEPPRYFHGYRRGRELGRGASGQVFVCHKKGTEGGFAAGFAVKAVDLRRLHLQPNAEREEKKLSREVEILKRLPPHPNIVQLVDTFEEGEWFLLVLELVGGGDLYTVLTNREPPRLHEREAAFVLAQLAGGLAFLHGQGVIHRDMKLENVLVHGERRERPLILYTVKITDFGLSKAIGAGFSEARSTVGTRPYTAPEVLREDSHDFSSDLWCLGVLLFVLLAGHFPFSKIPFKQEELQMIVGKLKISDTSKSVVLGLLQLEPRQRTDLATLSRHEWLCYEVESPDEAEKSDKPKRTRSVSASPSMRPIAPQPVASVPAKKPTESPAEAVPSEACAGQGHTAKIESGAAVPGPEPPAPTEQGPVSPVIVPPRVDVPQNLQVVPKRSISMITTGEVSPPSSDPEVMQLHLVVPDRLAGTIMGKGGPQLKQISSTLGCQVRMISRKTVGQHRIIGHHRIVIFGTYNQCVIVQELVHGRLMDALRAEGKEPTTETAVVLFVRAEAAGMVIGKQGWVLKQIRKQSNAKIQLLREEVRGQRPCIIEGELQSIIRAEKHVFDLVAAVQVVPPNAPAPTMEMGQSPRWTTSGPYLPRTRISAEPLTGKVVFWKGQVGWIEPEHAVNHPKAYAHKGQLYVHSQDVLNGETLSSGTQVRFHLYEDSSVAWLDVSGAPVLQTKPSAAAKSRPSSASTPPSRSAGSKEQPRPRSSSAQSQSSDLAADGPLDAKPKKKKKDRSKGTSGDKEEKEHKDAEAKTESAAGGESGRSEEPTPPWSAEEADTSTVVDEVSEAPDRSGQAAEEGGHEAWLRTRMERSAGFGAEEGDRWTLFEILEMLATKDNHKEEVLDSVGLSGQIKPHDTVYLRGHTGRWMAVKDGTQVLCNAADRTQAAAFVIEFKGPALKNDCRVGFKLDSADGRALWLGVLPSGDVGLLQKGDGGSDTSMRFVAKTTSPAAVLSGTSVHFKSMATGKMMEVDGADVRARSNTEGTRQRIAVEKLAVDISLPEPSPDVDLTVEQKAWAYLQAAHCALVDRQNLARFLSSPKPHCKELLKAYTKLWESEWRVEWRQTLEIPEESAASSPGSRQSSRSNSAGPAATSDSSRPRARSQSIRRRMSRTDWILGMVGGVSSTADDKSNGNLFVSAMRSFFANAIKMSQLEADPVQRVIEAFAEALVADAAFLSCFEASMLPEKERQTYRKPDEVLFGLAYTTLMLNTDMHNKQVASKMWDSKKFVGAGKGCGVTGGLMAQIYKNVQSEEI